LHAALRPLAPTSRPSCVLSMNRTHRLALLEQIVNINSGTMNLAASRGRDVLRAQLDELGFTTRWVDGAAFGEPATSSPSTEAPAADSC